jgi:hypothetical protein
MKLVITAQQKGGVCAKYNFTDPALTFELICSVFRCCASLNSYEKSVRARGPSLYHVSMRPKNELR